MKVRRSKAMPEVPSSSMADIAFLLLVFFLSTTTFSLDQGLLLQLPGQQSEVKRISRKNILVVKAHADGSVTLGNEFIAVSEIRGRIEEELEKNEKLVVVIETHPEARYEMYVDILDELKMAKAPRISLKTTGES
ncbi:MAG: biopolymer transporter ExbD [Candidatus Eisenbacteria sp.]|nr:biopolymer transporter ExbD [Candidatus Eisenbacteria bacterium]